MNSKLELNLAVAHLDGLHLTSIRVFDRKSLRTAVDLVNRKMIGNYGKGRFFVFGHEVDRDTRDILQVHRLPLFERVELREKPGVTLCWIENPVLQRLVANS